MIVWSLATRLQGIDVKRFIIGDDRHQIVSPQERLDDIVGSDTPSVSSKRLSIGLISGILTSKASIRKRPADLADHPSVLLKI